MPRIAIAEITIDNRLNIRFLLHSRMVNIGTRFPGFSAQLTKPFSVWHHLLYSFILFELNDYHRPNPYPRGRKIESQFTHALEKIKPGISPVSKSMGGL
jgi:hypothetical protein